MNQPNRRGFLAQAMATAAAPALARTGFAAAGSPLRGVYGGLPTQILDRGQRFADYGIDAVWIGSGGLSDEVVRIAREQKVRLFAEFNTLHAAELLDEFPDARPIGTDGKPCPPPDDWQGICPTHEGYRRNRVAAFRAALERFPIEGIWLDYHHAHASWEQAEPALPDTCFCDRCIALFEQQTGRSVPSGAPEARAERLLGPLSESWVAWRCQVFTDWIRELRAVRDEIRPGALLGTFQCPWTESEREGALRRKLAIDLRAQAAHIDVFSPMPYHARFGHAADPAWVGRSVAWLGNHLGVTGQPGERIRIWPIVQLSDWGEPVPVEQVEPVIRHGLTPPATGVMVFVWGSLAPAWEKVEAMQRTFVSLKK